MNSALGIHCGHLPSLANGIITIEKTASGEEASFSCNENYYLVGPKSRICLTNGTWSGDDPECISIFFTLLNILQY